MLGFFIFIFMALISLSVVLLIKEFNTQRELRELDRRCFEAKQKMIEAKKNMIHVQEEAIKKYGPLPPSLKKEKKAFKKYYYTNSPFFDEDEIEDRTVTDLENEIISELIYEEDLKDDFDIF